MKTREELTAGVQALIREAFDIGFEEGYETGQRITEWTSVKDALPEENGEYMVAWLPVGYDIPTNRKCFLGDFEFETGKWLEPLDVQRMYPRGVKVYAWAELPEQYELREEDINGKRRG